MGRPELIATEHRARWLYAGESAEGFVVRNLTATIDDLPAGLSGFRFLHISDLHLTRIWRPIYAEVAQKVQQLELDLVLCTGDIVDDKRDHRPALPNVLRFLPALKSRLGTFAILGNHDSPSLGDDLMAAGITLLHGQHILDTGLGQIEIIGTPGRFRRDLSHGFARGIPLAPAGEFHELSWPTTPTTGQSSRPSIPTCTCAAIPTVGKFACLAVGPSFDMINRPGDSAEATISAGARCT